MRTLTSNYNASFRYLNITQFLGALNDNLFKLLLVFFCIDMQGIEHSAYILAVSGAVFVLPFLLFSSPAGTLADRYSKRNIIVFCKALELVTMALGVIAFLWQAVPFAYFVLFLMATQSALFGPSKYGIVPELIPSDKLSKANGLLTSMTYLAIIIGTFFGSFLTDVTGRNFIVAACFCCVLSLTGLIASVCIRYTQPSGSNRPFKLWVGQEIKCCWPTIRKRSGLTAAILGASFAMFAAAFIQLNIVPYAIECLKLTDVQGGYLFLLTALGLGIGGLLAGTLSGNMVELGLVPLGGIGMVGTCFALEFCTHDILIVMALVFMIGLFGGIYMVPLDTFIQYSSPSQKRGQILAITNFCAFVGVLLASAMLFINSNLLGANPATNFAALGWLILGMTAAIVTMLYDHLVRYVGMLIARLQFKVTVYGDEQLPNDAPVVFLCNRTAWNDTLLLLGSQRSRVRFYSEPNESLTKRARRVQKLLKVADVPSMELVDQDEEWLEQILRHLNRGISICLFIDDMAETEVERLTQSLRTQPLLQDHPLISVTIERSEHCQLKKLARLFPKLRIPTEIQFENLIPQTL